MNIKVYNDIGRGIATLAIFSSIAVASIYGNISGDIIFTLYGFGMLSMMCIWD